MKRLLLSAGLVFAFAGSAIAAPVTYKIDPSHTDVVASWSHFGFSNPIAHFGEVDGNITYDPDNVGQSSVAVTIPLSAMETHVDAFNEHLRSDDFFDTEKYPHITFKSTRVEPAGGDKLRVWGDLTIRDVTREVLLDATINKIAEHPMAKRAAAGFDAITTIKRSDFGVDSYAPNVSDEVTLRITIEAMVPKAEAAATSE